MTPSERDERALLSRTFWEDNHGDKDGQLHDSYGLLERGADVTAQDGDGGRLFTLQHGIASATKLSCFW